MPAWYGIPSSLGAASPSGTENRTWQWHFDCQAPLRRMRNERYEHYERVAWRAYTALPGQLFRDSVSLSYSDSLMQRQVKVSPYTIEHGLGQYIILFLFLLRAVDLKIFIRKEN